MAKPKLRQINFRPVKQADEDLWVLEDPFELSDQYLTFPFGNSFCASQMNGQNSLSDIQLSMKEQFGYDIPLGEVDGLVQLLDEHYLLVNERSAQRIVEVRDEWEAQPFRPPAFAGLSYPDNSAELNGYFAQFSQGDSQLRNWQPWHGRGLISPHIDFHRGGKTYSKVWHRARAAIEEAELILIFGTDHDGRSGSITLSAIPYGTPYGVLPTDFDLVANLADAIGEENAFALELNHKTEHSIEFAAAWVHYIRRDCCPVVPIPVGGLDQCGPDRLPSDEPNIGRFVAALRKLTQGKKVFSIASVDLAHLGPEFNSDFVMDAERKQTLIETDLDLITSIEEGDLNAFYQQLAIGQNANNVCGFGPLYIMLDFMRPFTGELIAYDQCSADANDTSVVSICGMLLD